MKSKKVKIRKFKTGATRDIEDGKLDFEGAISPLVLWRFAEYMKANRKQANGSIREDGNWKKGMPTDSYMKSMWRHFHDVCLFHSGEGKVAKAKEIEEALCALLFNVQGYLYEVLKSKK